MRNKNSSLSGITVLWVAKYWLICNEKKLSWSGKKYDSYYYPSKIINDCSEKSHFPANEH